MQPNQRIDSPTTREIMSSKPETLSNVEIAAQARANQLCQGCGHPRSEHVEVLTPETQWINDEQENRTVLLCPQRIFAEKPPYDRKAGTDGRALSRI